MSGVSRLEDYRCKAVRSTMQIEHEPWLSKNSEGIQGKKIAIVGYSHYVDGPDRPSLTNDIVQCVVSGEYEFRFFRAIQSYFGFDDAADFWNRVVFFNFLPDAVGPKSAKYDVGTSEQLERGRGRFLRIISQDKPEKVFVFTSKGWRAFPETTIEELSGGACTPLIEGRKRPNWGTYRIDERNIQVCGFRHPQFANGEDMREQVRTFLELDLGSNPSLCRPTV